MPLGIVSDNDFEAELTSISPPKVEFISPNSPGRSPGDNNVPPSLRKIISDSAIKGESPESIKKAFGTSLSSISAYKNGSTSTASYNSPNSELTSFNQSTRLRISTRAKSRILMAMKHITDDKLKNVKARDLAGIAKDMSHVVKNMEGDSSAGNQNNNFVFVTPQNRSENEFDVIHVSK